MTDEEAQGRPVFFRLEGTSDAAVNYAADMTRRIDEGKALCAERGHHDTVADNPAICITCLAPLGDDHR